MIKRDCSVVISGDYSACRECGLSWDTGDADPPKCPIDTKKSALDALKCDLHLVNSTPCPLLRCRVCHMAWAISEDPMCPFRATLRTSPPSIVAWVQLGAIVFLAGLGGFILKSLMGY